MSFFNLLRFPKKISHQSFSSKKKTKSFLSQSSTAASWAFLFPTLQKTLKSQATGSQNVCESGLGVESRGMVDDRQLHEASWNQQTTKKRQDLELQPLYLGGNPKIKVFPPKWMVKIMENPINPWMIWGENPLFLETPTCLVYFEKRGEG